MRELMISLDKKILNKDSAVAQRMIEYGKKQELFILIPSEKKINLDLSPTVHVQSTGGHKIVQFFNLISLGRKILRNYVIQEITTQDPFFTGLAGLILSGITGKILEVQLHGDFFSSNYYRQSGLGNWFRYQLARKLVLNRADRLRVVGQRIFTNLVQIGVDKNKIIIQPVPIDYDFIKNYQPRFNLHDKYPGYEKIFLFLGRLDKVKNVFWLVNCFARVVKEESNWLLLIVGDGLEKEGIAEVIKIYQMEKNIKLEKWTDDPFSYVKTADCVLFPSLSEGYGMVAMEAHAAGTPIIMTDVGVANYELPAGPKVIITPLDDRDKFIQAILQL